MNTNHNFGKLKHSSVEPTATWRSYQKAFIKYESPLKIVPYVVMRNENTRQFKNAVKFSNTKFPK